MERIYFEPAWDKVWRLSKLQLGEDSQRIRTRQILLSTAVVTSFILCFLSNKQMGKWRPTECNDLLWTAQCYVSRQMSPNSLLTVLSSPLPAWNFLELCTNTKTRMREGSPHFPKSGLVRGGTQGHFRGQRTHGDQWFLNLLGRIWSFVTGPKGPWYIRFKLKP